MCCVDLQIIEEIWVCLVRQLKGKFLCILRYHQVYVDASRHAPSFALNHTRGNQWGVTLDIFAERMFEYSSRSTGLNLTKISEL